MKNSVWIVWFLLTASSMGYSDTYGLKSLECNSVLGSAYRLQVTDSELVFVESRLDVKSGPSKLVRYEHHVFPIASCRFEPFSINLACQDLDDKNVTLSVLLTRAVSKAKSHEVEFRLQGMPDAKSRTFRTTRIDLGKDSRCVVNDTFEVL